MKNDQKEMRYTFKAVDSLLFVRNLPIRMIDSCIAKSISDSNSDEDSGALEWHFRLPVSAREWERLSLEAPVSWQNLCQTY